MKDTKNTYEVIKVHNGKRTCIGTTTDEKLIDQIVDRFTKTKLNDVHRVLEHKIPIADFYNAPNRPACASADIFLNTIRNI
jgi:hypothetical protein